MRFALLGPLTVVDEAGERVPIPGPRVRVLLAALLVHANSPVPSEALAEAVWDGAPPRAAGDTLRSYIRRLRHALGSQSATRVVACDPGYLIRVEPAELDVLEFEALCRDAGAALRAGAWMEASAAAARALELWRGEPLLDVGSQVLCDRLVFRLELLRVQALEDAAEADLHLGRHAQLVPELRELARRHPLRERFHAQFVTALAGAGRRAEALEAYRDARRVLVAELGVEPGPELRDLQRMILADDGARPAATSSAGRAPTLIPVRAVRAVPHQLPAAPGHFTGRGSELELLAELSESSDPAADAGNSIVISAIDGMAGVGKTALAVHWAHRIAERFPDGQLFIDLHGYTQGYLPREPGEALEAFLRALGTPPHRIPPDVDERAALYRHRLADTRTLIVLDNAAGEAQVRPLLPAAPGCLVLVTSRKHLRGLYDAHAMTLEALSAADALALLHIAAGPKRAPVGNPALAEIAALCGRLPLALRIAAALLSHRLAWSPEHLAGLLRDQPKRTAALSDGERDMNAVFDLSYASLPEAHRRLFRRLGLPPGPEVDTFAAAALADTDPDTAARLLEDLVDHSLLIEHTPS